MVPNMIKKNKKRMRISRRVGRELSRDLTNLLIPGIELTVLRGLKILMTLIADTLVSEKNFPVHPIITTLKSS